MVTLVSVRVRVGVRVSYLRDSFSVLLTTPTASLHHDHGTWSPCFTTHGRKYTPKLRPLVDTDTGCDTFICSQFPCGRYPVCTLAQVY